MAETLYDTLGVASKLFKSHEALQQEFTAAPVETLLVTVSKA